MYRIITKTNSYKVYKYSPPKPSTYAHPCVTKLREKGNFTGFVMHLREDGGIFYHQLCSRGYPHCMVPQSFLRRVFQQVTLARRSVLPALSSQKECNKIFKTYWACVSTLCNAPKWPALREQLDLSLRELTESTFNKDIFSSFF